MKFVLSITISLLLNPSFILSQNTTITSFSKSKKYLAKVYKDNPITLYCGCSFKRKTPEFSSCGYIPKKDNKRANRIEWSMLSQHMCLESSFLNGQSVTQNVSRRTGKNTKDEGVQVRSTKNSREWKQICTISFQQLVKLMV